jgi:hypothetical protein
MLPQSFDGTNWVNNGVLSEKISAGPFTTWAVDKSNVIKKYQASTWSTVTGNARDIAVGAEGTAMAARGLTTDLQEFVFIITNTEKAAFEGMTI